MFVDYHVHSKFSPDGESSILELVEAAVIREISEIAITDHYEGISPLGKYEDEEYIEAVDKVAALYRHDIKVKKGLELGYPYLWEEMTRDLLAKHKYDFILASVHGHDNIDYYLHDFTHEDIDAISTKYFEEIHKTIGFADFDCLGHIDLLKRYAFNYGIDYNIMNYKEELEYVLKRIIGINKGIEINTSGLRQKVGSTMPELDVVKFYRELGGEIITVGSDSHYATDVGNGIDVGIEIALMAGFQYIATFTERKCEFIRI